METFLSDEVIQELKNQIKKSQIQNKITKQNFKNDECVICLTNPPNVLFCNCGHLCLCVECDAMKCLDVCPMCKTENTLKRTI